MQRDAYADMLAVDLGEEIMAFFEDDGITEIAVEARLDRISIDRKGRGLVHTDVGISKENVISFLNRVAHAQNQVLTEHNTGLEAALPQKYFRGARLTGAIPPTAVHGPTFCIRFLPEEPPALENFLENEVLTPNQFEHLVEAIKAYHNIAIIGGGGTGKTYLLMALMRKAGELYPSERFVSIEDTPELRMAKDVFWHSLKGDDYGALIKKAKRFSPKRLIVTEARDESIIRVLDALRSGHDGSGFTFHSSSARQALGAMYDYCLRSSNTTSHHRTLGDAIDLLIVLGRDEEKGRYVKEVVHLDGYDPKEGEYLLTPIH